MNNLILFLISLLIFSFNTYAQKSKGIIGLELERDKYKRFEQECYLNEQQDRDDHKKCREIYDGVMEKHDKKERENWKNIMDQFFNQKGKLLDAQTRKDKQFWGGSCHNFYPFPAKYFRKSIPESCLILGEFYEKARSRDCPSGQFYDHKKGRYKGTNCGKSKIKAYEKACGINYFDEKLLNSEGENRKEMLDTLAEYGCVTNAEAKQFNLTKYGIKQCTDTRLIACLRLANIYVKSDSKLKANKYFTRLCDAGVEEGCKKKKDKEDRFWLVLYAAIGGFGLATFILMRMFFQETSEFQATEQLEEGQSLTKEEIAKHGFILKYSRPVFKYYISPVVSSMKFKRKIKEKYKQPLP